MQGRCLGPTRSLQGKVEGTRAAAMLLAGARGYRGGGWLRLALLRQE
ncbi:hypothetical protein LNQ03_03520 [Klebsiella pneumoniae subsp. pneumoniae]|nr:hypothetical protein [Klebsiella pneumoniae subsp. pneumoniae]